MIAVGIYLLLAVLLFASGLAIGLVIGRPRFMKEPTVHDTNRIFKALSASDCGIWTRGGLPPHEIVLRIYRELMR